MTAHEGDGVTMGTDRNASEKTDVRFEHVTFADGEKAAFVYFGCMV